MALCGKGSLVASALADGAALFVKRRGYAAAAETVQREVGRTVEGKTAKGASADEAASSWVPDPVSGYYRPANRKEEIVGEVGDYLDCSEVVEHFQIEVYLWFTK